MADSRPDSSPSDRPSGRDPRRDTDAPQDLPHFTLLADPTRIVGDAARTGAQTDAAAEVERLRAELSRRSFELQELRRDLSLQHTLRATRERELEALKEEADALRQQLARDAGPRQERGRDGFELATLRARIGELERNLARSEQQSEQARASTDSLQREVERLREEESRRETALAELRSTLGIARETIDSRRVDRERSDREWNALREQNRRLTAEREDIERALSRAFEEAAARGRALCEAEAAVLALDEALDARQRDLERAERRLGDERERAAAQESERDRIGMQLRESSECRRRLEDELQQCRQQLDAARDLAERERDECERLMRALALIEKTAAGRSRATPEASEGHPGRESDPPPEPGPAAIRPAHAPASDRDAEAPPAHESTGPESEVACPPGRTRTAIFDYWRDAQIRQELALEGVASAEKFFAREIARSCARSGERAGRVLVLAGAAAGDLEARLIERLTPLVAQLPHIDALQPFTDADLPPEGLRYDCIVSDEALAAWFGRSPSAERLEALLTSLRNRLQPAGRWIMLERLAAASPGEGTRAGRMLERIFKLMPERYRHDHLPTHEPAQLTARRADADGDAASGQNARSPIELLQTHFEFEAQALFGCLADAFVGETLGPNFDPDSPADRRFIDQVASLDAAKIRAGVLAPLHLAAIARANGSP